MARPDEALVSVNGSPLMVSASAMTAIRATIGKSRTAVARVARPIASSSSSSSSSSSVTVATMQSAAAKRAGPGEAEDVAIDVALGNGKAVDLANPSVQAKLTTADRAAAKAKLLALQNQVASILSSLDA
jgi:BRCT domain type II-containing protein